MIFTPLFLLVSLSNGLSDTGRHRTTVYGVCFRSRKPEGCHNFIAFMSRRMCCMHNGYFVRQYDQGRVFLSITLRLHTIPNCEKPCGKDFCKYKKCQAGEYCIARSRNSICSSDCQCTEKQKRSGPICVENGRIYRSFCDYHLESCWSNTKQKIIPCKQFGCDAVVCQRNQTCRINLQGNTECTDNDIRCPPISSSSDDELLCGVDNRTYSNKCELKRAGIRIGREIHVAYRGKCKADATCSNVICPASDMTCVEHYKTQSPVCVNCPLSLIDCLRPEFYSNNFFCTSNETTARNFCYLNFLSCQNRKFVEIIHSGPCLMKAKRPF